MSLFDAGIGTLCNNFRYHVGLSVCVCVCLYLCVRVCLKGEGVYVCLDV
jgi:hypothetical protein